MRARQILEAILPMTAPVDSTIGKAMAKWVWVRWGDASSYEKYDAISEIPFDEYLKPGSKIKSWGSHFGNYGLVVEPSYGGWNFISIYWGDDDANAVRTLTEEEKAEVKRMIEEIPGY